MGQKIQLKDKDGNLQYPVTSTTLVVDAEGRTAEQRLQALAGGISQSAADKRYIRKVVDNFDSDLTFAVADGIVGTDDEYYFIPAKAPSTAFDSQILATKADVAHGGGGGKIEYRTFLTGDVDDAGKAENLASLNAFLEGKALLYYLYAEGDVTHNISLVEYIVVDGVYVFRFDYEDTTLSQILVEVSADGTASEDIIIVEKIFDPKLIADSTNAPQTRVVYEALQEKQDTLVDGVTIKTINGESILGEGDITIQGGGGDTSGFATKEELAEAEEVAAAALVDLEGRKADKEYVASSLNDLENRKADKEAVEDAITSAIASAIITTLNTEV